VQEQPGVDDGAAVLENAPHAGAHAVVERRRPGDETQYAHAASKIGASRVLSRSLEQQRDRAGIAKIDNEVDVDRIAAVAPHPVDLKVDVDILAFLVRKVGERHQPVGSEIILDLRLVARCIR